MAINPYFTLEKVQVDDLRLVCDICKNTFHDLEAELEPTLIYKIDQGLLLRRFNIHDVQGACEHIPEMPGVWLFWEEWQTEMALQDIIDFQKQHIDGSHHIHKLREARPGDFPINDGLPAPQTS